MEKTFIIAEVGSAWVWEEFNDATIKRGIEAIEIAASCGADMLKMQWTSSSARMAVRRSVGDPSVYARLQWPREWMPIFANEAENKKIEFGATCFLPEDVETLNPYVKRWKVASLECENDALINAMEATGKPVIISSGAMGFNLVPALLGASILHCTAAYPAPLEQLNLRAIKSCSGYSDHSRNKLTGAIAVACGAKIVEVHFKLFHTPIDNPDYNHSLYEPELRQYIANIRQAELMLGDGTKKVEKCEEWALKHKVRS